MRSSSGFSGRSEQGRMSNPLPLIFNCLLILNTPIRWYLLLYWEYLILGGAGGGLMLGRGDYDCGVREDYLYQHGASAERTSPTLSF